MRRKDREMDEKFALSLIDQADYGVLSFCKENKSYSRPLYFARNNRTLYFHSATQGEKVKLLSEGMDVELVFVGDIRVPKLYKKEEVKERMEKEGPRLLLNKVFTTEFSSTMARGKIRLVNAAKEKKEALRKISQDFTPDMMEFFDEAVEMSLDKVLIYAVELYEIRGKRKKFDEKGEEMKWGRME